jgi:hypothetical protein
MPKKGGDVVGQMQTRLKTINARKINVLDFY